jgi:hypothetical protein
MKNKLFLILAFSFAACNSDKNTKKPEQDSWTDLLLLSSGNLMDSVSGTIQIVANTIHFNNSGYVQGSGYVANAVFYASPQDKKNHYNPVNVGSQVNVGGFNLIKTPDPTHAYFIPSSRDTAFNSTSFGKKIFISHSGNTTAGLQPLIDSMYSPKVIKVTSSLSTEHSKSSSLTLNWNIDSSNPNQMVFILVTYEINGEFQEMYQFNETVNDLSGTHTIASSKFTNFPVGGRLAIDVFRGNYKVHTSADGKKTLIYSYTRNRAYAKLTT